jgi:drug/metabolite transporter (DMT)-like permease
MDEGWIALGLIFVGLLVVAAGLFYYMALGLSEQPVDSRVFWGLMVAGGALFFAGGTIWRRGIPKK